jgi:hypothetical protein
MYICIYLHIYIYIYTHTYIYIWQIKGGEIWEQLILLIDAAFVALSATLGDVEHFQVGTQIQTIFLILYGCLSV